jgi:hypothetical protein
MATSLRYLDFDVSEDTEGIGTFEAMASVSPDQVPHVQAEIATVLDWAFARFPGAHGPLDEGFAWDHDLQSHRDGGWHTLTLSVSGDPRFCLSFRQRFLPEESA